MYRSAKMRKWPKCLSGLCTVHVHSMWKCVKWKHIWQYHDKMEWRVQTGVISSRKARVQCYKLNNNKAFVFCLISSICLCDLIQDSFPFSLFEVTSSSWMWSDAQKQEAIPDSLRQQRSMSTWIFSVCPLARGNGIKRKMASWIWREWGFLAK